MKNIVVNDIVLCDKALIAHSMGGSPVASGDAIPEEIKFSTFPTVKRRGPPVGPAPGAAGPGYRVKLPLHLFPTITRACLPGLCREKHHAKEAQKAAGAATLVRKAPNLPVGKPNRPGPDRSYVKRRCAPVILLLEQ